MPANLRPYFALRVDREGDARDHGVAANAEGDAGVNQRIGGGEHLGVAVNIERTLGGRERAAVVAGDAEFVESAARAVARYQQLQVFFREFCQQLFSEMTILYGRSTVLCINSIFA